jgi:hypothetical protein
VVDILAKLYVQVQQMMKSSTVEPRRSILLEHTECKSETDLSQ